PQEVNEAAQAAQKALTSWRETPPGDRIQYLFKLKNLLEENFEDLSRQITMECGKTIVEARGEMRRAIENVEVASGIPTLLQGAFSEDICPFNFPGMIPFWFMPYALACGNTVIVKPSEKVPLTMQKIFALMEQCGFPKGVVNLVNGAKDTVDAILDHPLIRAISMVGSTPVARYIYSRATANGKRAQCQGGAKNISVVLPDADLETSTRVLADSAFGSAGQRCLATSIVATVGEVKRDFVEAICEIARNRVVGYGLDEGVEMGPVITPQSKARIEGLIGKALEEDATILVDGRGAVIPGYEKGNFVKPTVILNIPPQGELFRTEIFGPVLSIMPVNTIEEAIDLVNLGDYGNMACLFTKSGEAARKFRYSVQAGNVGINIGVAAPMAYFPFSGWKESFFGDLHGQSMDAVEFFTQKKVVIERWPKEWSRKF
ncbi:MAG: CoA-acylating methylmalonate-semialdehyde dehydrogenase, partial [Anaerolineales bacterium]